MRDVHLVAEPLGDLLGIGDFEEQLDGLGEVPLRFLDRVALAGNVELGTAGRVPVASRSMTAV